MVDQIRDAFKKVSRLECELVKALEDLDRAFEEEGIASKTLIQGIIDQLDDDMYDLECEIEELIGDVV